MKTTVLAATAVLALAAPAFAQQHGHAGHGAATHDMHEGMAGMQGGMAGMHDGMGAMKSRPAALLEHADHLGLTPEQVERLEGLRDRSGTEHGRHMEAAMEAHRAAASVLEGETPDLVAYEAALTEAAAHMVQAHVAGARTALEARALLTDPQREALDAMAPGMHHGSGAAGGHGGHHPGGR